MIHADPAQLLRYRLRADRAVRSVAHGAGDARRAGGRPAAIATLAAAIWLVLLCAYLAQGRARIARTSPIRCWRPS